MRKTLVPLLLAAAVLAATIMSPQSDIIVGSSGVDQLGHPIGDDRLQK